MGFTACPPLGLPTHTPVDLPAHAPVGSPSRGRTAFHLAPPPPPDHRRQEIDQPRPLGDHPLHMG